MEQTSHNKHFLKYVSPLDTPELIRNRVSQLGERQGFSTEVHVSATRDERGDYQGYGHLFVKDSQFHTFLLTMGSSDDISDQDLKITACASEVPGLSLGAAENGAIIHIGIADPNPDPAPPLHKSTVITAVIPPGVSLEWVRSKIEVLCEEYDHVEEKIVYPVITTQKTNAGEVLRCVFDPEHNHGTYIMLMVRRLWYPLINGSEVCVHFFYEKMDRRSYDTSRGRKLRERYSRESRAQGASGGRGRPSVSSFRRTKRVSF